MRFDMPLFAMPALFRGFAEQGAVRAKASCQQIKATSAEIAEVLHETYSANAKSSTQYGAKLIDVFSENTRSALDFMADLMETRSLSEALSLSARQSRQNLEVVSALNRELWELAQNAATESATPIKKTFAKLLQGAA